MWRQFVPEKHPRPWTNLMERIMDIDNTDEALFTIIEWDSDHIKDMFDNNPNITLKELSRKSGHNVSDLVKILKDHVGD